MKYRIDDEGGDIDVRIEQAGADDADLLAALKRCREGRCDCPTDEYEKVEELRIERDEGGISLHLAVKPGQAISQKAVATCLDHTIHGKK